MLPLHILPKNTFCRCKPSSRILFQWINISARLCSSSSSSSSSSDSSDSDSDTEKAKPDTTPVESASPANTTSDSKYDLENFLKNMLQAKKLQKTIDVAMQPKNKSKDKSNNDKHMPFEKKIINAAKDVAETLGGDKTKTTSDLLEKVLASRVEALREAQAKIQKNTKFKFAKSQRQQLPKYNIQENYSNKHSEEKSTIQTLMDEYNKFGGSQQQLLERNIQEDYQKKHSEKKSIIQTLLDEYKSGRPQQQLLKHKIQEDYQDKHLKEKAVIETLWDEHNKQQEDSRSRNLLKEAKMSEKQLQDIDKKELYARHKSIDLWNGEPSHIFENINAASPNIPELKTWAALEQRELKALTTYSPANIFQELILWTEQGKLWKFPIDNEQGMEEEQSVHFSEHVFMERHLKGWCPKSGPIRHFMELVCVGLSKNPYLTVQEKIQHIMWYKEYFESKQDLLQETGAIQEPFLDKVKEITG